MKKRVQKICFVASALIVAQTNSGSSAEFIPFGMDFNLTAVSPDGRWLTGSVVLPEQPPGGPLVDRFPVTGAFRWTRSTGAVLIEPSDFRRGTGISNDGSVVGSGRAMETGSGPFVWSPQQGVVDLGGLPATLDLGYATDISAAGSVIVGGIGEEILAPGYGSNPQAFRWTAATGLVGLGDLPGGLSRSYATAVSPDANIVVGEGTYFGVGGEAFRWTAEIGMEGLGFLADRTQSTATDVSSDGRVVVGYGHGLLAEPKAFRWVEGVGIADLGFRIATAVTGDGQTVVGHEVNGSGEFTAIIWDSQHGKQKLQDVLINQYGLAEALAGWELTGVTDISVDGRTMIGGGVNPAGQGQAWAFTTVVPEPTGAAIAAVGVGLLLSKQRLSDCGLL